MIKNTDQLVTGTATLALLTLAIKLAASLNLIFPKSIIEWISASGNPDLALWVTSGLIACTSIILIKVGVKLPILKPWVDEKERPLFLYVFGLPLQAAISILIFLGIFLAFLAPVCESPTANITVSPISDSVIYNAKSITAKSGSKLTIEATIDQSAMVFCSWSSTGSAIKTIGPKSLCKTRVDLASEPGRGIVMLTLSKSFCAATSTNPLEIIVVP